jgi:hypothetical protein
LSNEQERAYDEKTYLAACRISLHFLSWANRFRKQPFEYYIDYENGIKIAYFG